MTDRQALRLLLVNSTFAFACAELLMVALHEAGHGLTAQALGFSPKIYGFYEDNPTGTPTQNLLILAGGPIASLVLGCLFLAWYRSKPAHYSFGRLLLFWMAWLGIMEFVNYLIVTPWLSLGDTAQIANILGLGAFWRYVVAAAGVAALALLARPAAISMFAAAPSSVPLTTPRERRRLIMLGFYLPLIFGTLLTAAGGIGGQPVIVGVGLLGTFGNIDIVALALYRAGEARLQRSADASLKVEGAGIVLYVALAAFYALVLARGMPV